MVVFSDCRVQIFDSQTGDKLKSLDQMPALPWRQNTRQDCLDAAVFGGELLILGQFGHANPAILTLNDKLEYCVKAFATLQRETLGEVNVALITDPDSVLMVTNETRQQNMFKVTDLSVLTEQDQFLRQADELAKSGLSCNRFDEMLDLRLYA